MHPCPRAPIKPLIAKLNNDFRRWPQEDNKPFVFRFISSWHVKPPVVWNAEQLAQSADDDGDDDDAEAVEMSGINRRAWVSQAFTVETGGLGGESVDRVGGAFWSRLRSWTLKNSLVIRQATWTCCRFLIWANLPKFSQKWECFLCLTSLITSCPSSTSSMSQVSDLFAHIQCLIVLFQVKCALYYLINMKIYHVFCVLFWLVHAHHHLCLNIH